MFKKRKEDMIDGFNAYFEYLKPEFPAKVMYQNETYNSVAHAYMAAKIPADDAVMKRRILKAPTYKDMMEISVTVEASPEFLQKRS